MTRRSLFILRITAIGGVVLLFCYILLQFSYFTLQSFAKSAMPNTCNDLLVLIDKTQDHALPGSYVPPDLVSLSAHSIPAGSSSIEGRQIVVPDLQRLFTDIKKDGITDLKAVSSYRSYDLQSSIYNSYVKEYGAAEANRFSAQPGHSQHQLGTAIDFSTSELNLNYTLSDVFAQTKAGQWLAKNAYKYGFYISYPEGKENVTGYEYEPWHFRYIGVQNALLLHQSGLTMQEYLATIGEKPSC